MITCAFIYLKMRLRQSMFFVLACSVALALVISKQTVSGRMLFLVMLLLMSMHIKYCARSDRRSRWSWLALRQQVSLRLKTWIDIIFFEALSFFWFLKLIKNPQLKEVYGFLMLSVLLSFWIRHVSNTNLTIENARLYKRLR